MTQLYRAEYGDKTIEIETDFKNLVDLVSSLNGAGFNLGFGHDGLNIKEQGKKIVLVCNTFVGGPTQHITFTPIMH